MNQTAKQKGLYSNRASNCHCHHWHSRGAAVARNSKGQGESQADRLPQQSKANLAGDEDVYGRLQRLRNAGAGDQRRSILSGLDLRPSNLHCAEQRGAVVAGYAALESLCASAQDV